MFRCSSSTYLTCQLAFKFDPHIAASADVTLVAPLRMNFGTESVMVLKGKSEQINPINCRLGPELIFAVFATDVLDRQCERLGYLRESASAVSFKPARANPYSSITFATSSGC